MPSCARLCVACLLCVSGNAMAHQTEFEDGGSSGLDAGNELTPPFLKSHTDPVYPPEAFAKRLAGSVGLELLLNEAGKVVDVRVTQSAGHGFDEAAVAAAKEYVFEPARLGGVPTPVVVKYVSEFTPPVEVVVPVPAPAPAMTTVVQAQRPISAASSFSVRDRDFQLRPIGSVQDILRVTPGLVMVQHSGGGKANQ